MKLSHFFAYLNRLRWIRRWGLKRNVVEENVMEHSWQVATIAHALAVISNRHFDGNLDAERIAVLGLYHDVSEVITGDMPTPIKYHSPTITQAYKAIEEEAERDILGMLPESLQPDFRNLLLHENIPEEQQRIVKYADLISAYLKCEAEIRAGNTEFSSAFTQIENRIRDTGAPEVDYFMSHFVEAYTLTLDDMLNYHDRSIGLKK
ncbi:MAG: 5'-deoxynucleotidase [Natronospirillum sp.]|uniref:5'-deoxynucleotidase n=1 Tax=Natronospirillum sp. TaxID=2812955 RepID=UPI0025FCF7B0|nr:5'-deoxynucleotidase [Natronospirillum sp.]MCH8550899.1 5'-deoxynucleotidase [Natronospirillum sp.]